MGCNNLKFGTDVVRDKTNLKAWTKNELSCSERRRNELSMQKLNDVLILVVH